MTGQESCPTLVRYPEIMAAELNPLLRIDFRVPFDRIRAEHVEPGIRQLLAEAKERVEALARGGETPTFDNTLMRLDMLSEPLDCAMGIVKHLEAVATYPELRAAHNLVEPAVSEFNTSIPLHSGLWKALQSYAATEDARGLQGTPLRYLTKTLDDFRRHGAELDPTGKARLAEIDIELTKLTTKFSENVLDATNAFELVINEKGRLAGLPPSAVAAARESAVQKNIEGWRFTLQAPSYTPLMMYLDDAGIREQVYRAFATRASSGNFDNRPLIGRILELRREKANLLGYRNFADFALADRMALTGAQALEFLTTLRDKTQARYEAENRELLKFRRSLEGENAPDLEPWDLGYYAEKQRVALFDFDQEALRPYFPLEHVVEGMFEIVQRLYGVCIEEEAGAPSWDPQVRYYVIRDKDGTKVGAFYADWYPRENKRGEIGRASCRERV
jgi:oligopeptidase A